MNKQKWNGLELEKHLGDKELTTLRRELSKEISKRGIDVMFEGEPNGFKLTLFFKTDRVVMLYPRDKVEAVRILKAFSLGLESE